MIHLCGWAANLDPAAGTDTYITALKDSALYTSMNDLRIPAGMGRVEMVGAITASPANVNSYAWIESPYLLRRAPFQVQPLNGGADWGINGGIVPARPSLMLTPQESVRAGINLVASPSAAELQAVLMLISDAAPQPVQSGEVMTIRMDAAAASTTFAWTQTQLSFQHEIPYGDYRIIGIYAMGSGLIGARLVLPGYTWRPGCPASRAGQLGVPELRMGRFGELGRFNSNQPPSAEVLMTSAGSPHIWLDLVPM